MKCRAAAKSLTEVQIWEWTNKTIKASAEEIFSLQDKGLIRLIMEDETKSRDKNIKFMPATHGLLKAHLLEDTSF